MGVTNFDVVEADLLVGGVKLPVVAAGADGPITLRAGVVMLTKASAAAMMLAAPSADDDGKILHIIAATAQAHTVTVAGGVNGGGAGADVGTFGGAVGDRVSLVAYDGKWYELGNVNVTFA